jgi:transposase-like protein
MGTLSRLDFAATWAHRKFLRIHRHWRHVIPLCAHPPEVRKMIYTTNAIESLNAKLRRSVRSRGHIVTHSTSR